MKKYNVTVTRTDEYIVEIDETIYNEEWMKDFERYFHPLDGDMKEIAIDLATEVLNDLKEADLIINEDIYANGSILFAEAIDVSETRQILSKVISDIDQYWKENNDCFIDSVTDIPLNLLDDEFTHHFKDEIYLDKDTEIFFHR